MSDDKPKGLTLKVPKRSQLLAIASGIQTEPLDELDRARRAAAEMERATELLNQTLIAAEKKFTELGLGVMASTRMWLDQEDASETCLCFGKEGKEWKLYILASQLDGAPDDFETSSLLSSSRETRVRAVEVLPALFEALVKEAEDRATYLNNQLRTANEFLEKLEAK